MTDSVTNASVLLIVGPLLGAVPIANPRLIRVWSMARDDHVRTVGANRRAWALLNAGFGFATVLTTTGLLILAAAEDPATARAAGLDLAWLTYALGGVLWLAVLAIRTRTTPAQADLDARGMDPGPAETLIGSATGGLFNGFVVLTSAALIVLGVTWALSGGVSLPVAGLIVIGGVGCLGWLAVAGDVIPAVLYLPTLLLGVAILAGW